MSNHPRARRQQAALGVAAVVVAPVLAQAQVVLDGSVGPSGPVAGPHFDITDGLGTVRGGNLFHSFEKFNIRRGESATFSGPAGLDRVIARVTGGDISNINGLLRSSIAGADFFLVNPSGVVVGPSATVDVGGALVVSTADELRFADGAVFSVGSPETTVLTTAAPAAFGFLAAQPAGVTFRGFTHEAVSPIGFDIVAGPVAIEDSAIEASPMPVRIVAVGGPGQVQREEGGVALEPADGLALGPVTIDDSAILASAPGVAVQVRGSHILLRDTTIGSLSFSTPIDHGGIDLEASESLRLRGGLLFSQAFGTEDGPPIRMSAPRVDVHGGVQTRVDVGASGAGGGVEIEGGRVTIGSGAHVRSETLGDGSGGAIVIRGGRLVLEGGAIVESDTDASAPGAAVTLEADGLAIRGEAKVLAHSDGDGRGGDVLLRADRVRFSGGGLITAGSFTTLGVGPAGDIDVRGRTGGRAEVFEVTGEGGGFFSGLYVGSVGDADPGELRVLADEVRMSANGALQAGVVGGRSGRVNVDANRVSLDHAYISGASDGGSDAGAVSVTARDTLRLTNGAAISSSSLGEGRAGRVVVRAGDVTVDGVSEISSIAAGDGGAGSVDVRAGGLTLRGGSLISSSTAGAGDAGTVVVRAGDILLDSGSTIRSQAEDVPAQGLVATGSGGSVTIVARSLTLRNLGTVTSSAFGSLSGDSGDVTIRLRDDLRIEGLPAGENFETGVFALTTSRLGSDAGSVDVSARNVYFTRGGLSVFSLTGDAGDLTLTARNSIVATNDGLLGAEAILGSGGNVKLTAADSVIFRESEIFATALSSDGGRIDIDPRFIIIDDSPIVSLSANQNDFVRLDPNAVVLISQGDEILASNVSAPPELDLSSDLAPLRLTLSDDLAQLFAQCTIKLDEAISSFIVVGRGGLPPMPGEPGGWVPAYAAPAAFLLPLPPGEGGP